ncbi:hypothetical protein CORT_0B02130 [Candida orthopsilosis Co 90-125]|uniref:Uncharacterized protein n=1 Tax=Candida orthopsilosis (strain 90-125) TaxID=1136231 RepID=H8X0P2_CANO9|nr:hypothetical protein CORT_0B02130 [Candida orthopsilosis Co 90-125]CCG21931.1 hypothetical protein CORT_0B02130 [Candida orthopsilosis Co 90-125]
MTEPEVAPYGGFIVKTLEDEKANEAQLEELAIEVEYNGTTQKLRPEALRLNGVDNLSTEEIKSYVDYYLNYTTSRNEELDKIEYNQIPFDEQITFRVEWIDDSNVNVVFKTNQDNLRALRQLSRDPIEIDDNDSTFINEVIQERRAKDYNPIISFRSSQSLSNRLGLKEKAKDNEQEGMIEDESSIELRIRQSFQSDRKVKNASQYSRYYLIHGEPERPRRSRPIHRHRRREPEILAKKEEEQEDLFADKLKQGRSSSREQAIDEEEEDLFADKLKRSRSRSPTRSGTSRYSQR